MLKRSQSSGRGYVIADLIFSLLLIALGVFLWVDAASPVPLMGNDFYSSVHLGYFGAALGKLILLFGCLWLIVGIRAARKRAYAIEVSETEKTLESRRLRLRPTWGSWKRAKRDVWFFSALGAVLGNIILSLFGGGLVLGIIGGVWAFELLDHFQHPKRRVLDCVVASYISLNLLIRAAYWILRGSLPDTIEGLIYVGYVFLMLLLLSQSMRKGTMPWEKP